jgi:glycosyltransferase involved in cell wall biosynthesis
VNVAHCIHGLGLGGAQRVIKLLVDGADGDGRPFVYSTSGGVFAGEVANGAVVRVFPRRFPKVDPTLVFRLAHAMRRDPVDLVHTHLFGDSLHGYLAARLARKPVVMTLHNVARSHSRLQRAGYRWLMSRVACTVGCSEAVRLSFLADARDKNTSIVTITNGVEPAKPLDRDAARARLGCGRAALTIGSTGRLVASKDFPNLVSALATVVRRIQRPVRLFILGDGPLRGEILTHAGRMGVAPLVQLLGFRADAPELLNAFDIVAFSSADEGLPMALLEAMAAGRCIVATNVGGIADAVRDGDEALLVPAADSARLADALVRALEDGDLRTRLGAAAARRFRTRFTADQMVREYGAVYRTVLASWRGGDAAPDEEPRRVRSGVER